MTRMILVLVLAFAGAAWAAGIDDAKQCASTSGDLSIHYCTRAIQSGELSNRGLARTFYNRGVKYSRKGDYDRAIRDYDQAIRLKLDNAKAFYNRGSAYSGKGEYDRAIRDFDQAIRLKPDYAFAYGNRGGAYEKLGQIDAAIRDYRKQYDLGSRPQWLIDRLKGYGAL